MIQNKLIVLGVTGGIAAYKAAEIARRLIKEGAIVKVIMTKAATHFITPLTFRAITNQPVATSLFENRLVHPLSHISLAKEADLVLVAPATANFIAKAAHGIADDLLSTTILAVQVPILVAPAMNSQMYLNPVTQNNLKLLKKRGFRIIGPAKGKLIEGEGIGRLADLGEIIEAIKTEFANRESLEGKKVLITAGGTREFLDSVRFITNRSSGKMGYALAREALTRKAQVTLISAPTDLQPPPGVEFVSVVSAGEMRREVLKRFNKVDIVIMAAAVGDFKAVEIQKGKIKRSQGEQFLKLVPTDDILAELGQRKDKQILVGFSAETENLVSNAKQKLREKNLDLIVANDIARSDIGFGSDYNQVVMINSQGKLEETPRLTKAEIARLIFDRIATEL